MKNEEVLKKEECPNCKSRNMEILDADDKKRPTAYYCKHCGLSFAIRW